MFDRVKKRWAREHRAKATAQWTFHKVPWGDLVVSVMPKSVDGKVVDSNTGVVIEAPYHAGILACVVVNDGRKMDCDPAALNMHMTGDRQKAWDGHAYGILYPIAVWEGGFDNAYARMIG